MGAHLTFAANMKIPIDELVEETHTGICGDGFDNFLLYAEGLGELRQYVKALNKIGAPRSAEVIQSLIDWVKSGTKQTPLEVIMSDTVRANELWRNYLEASREEDPQALARKKAPKRKTPRMPVSDREYYEFYGPEDKARPCRREGCDRGSVNLSVLCRTHHFESAMRKPCPWID